LVTSGSERVYSFSMAFTLWLSAEEERILEGIMRLEGARTKQTAVIQAILDKGDRLTAERHTRETPVASAVTLPGQSTPPRG
jgi:hypothetical protein